MFKRLKLSNFRQHRDLEVNFVPGLNAIRGVNEAGKTTLLEAAAYVLFGSRLALRESLDQVVTYGEKVSSLKTELDMDVNGVVYCGKRSKSGAEVWLAGGVSPLVVGQDECTRFWETLLGVSGKVASNLMLANQTGIRGALEGGASAPVLLIEKLANFSVIDTIINLVMDEVPNGRTKDLDARIAEIEAQLEQPLDDSAVHALKEKLDAADLAAFSAKETHTAAQRACDAQRPAAEAAQKLANEAASLSPRVHDASVRVAQTKRALAEITVPAAPSASRIAELRRGVDAVEHRAKAQTAHTALSGLKPVEVEWDEGMEKLLAAISAADAASKEAAAKEREYRDQATQARAAIIRETSCAFCGKDLTDVPEVTTHNTALQNKLDSALALAAEWREKIVAAEGEIADLRAVVADSNARDRVYQRHAEFLTVDEQYVPARWTWTGPDLSKPVTDPREELRRLEQQQRSHDQLSGAHQQAVAALASAEAKEQELRTALDTATAAAAACSDALTVAHGLASKLASAELALRDAQQAHQAARGAHETAVAVHGERRAARERLEASLAVERITRENTLQGNTLLDKLRNARPQIADKLWKVVLASVSTYFSSVRGKASVVTREDNGFQVDGQPVEGLSGSTLDALGLAIRVALVKTFLPNCGFMVLDEPQAACDDTRSVNMLGLVASVGFDQVVLVTHSDTADSFAQNVIQL